MSPLVLILAAASWADGGLALSEIEDLVRFHATDFAPCRARGATDCVVRFGIAADGGVDTYSVIVNGRSDTGVCVNKVLRAWAFPARPEGTLVQLAWSPREARAAVVAPEAGRLSLDQLLAVQLEHKEEIARCYVQFRVLAQNSGLLSVTARIGPSGVVLSTLEGEPSIRLVGSEVPRCVADMVRSWKFPQAQLQTDATLEWLVADTPEQVEALRSDDHPRAVRITSGDTTEVSTVLSKSALGRAIQHQLGTLAECAPDAGSVELSFDVRRVPHAPHEVAVHDKAGRELLNACVERVVATWTLPEVAERTVDVVDLELSRMPRFAPKPLAHLAGLDKDVIMKVIKSHQAEVKFCYEQQLAKERFEGKLSIRWTIGPFGDVVSVEIAEDTLKFSSVGDCVRERIERWKFPPPRAGGVVNVTFPWIFKAVGD